MQLVLIALSLFLFQGGGSARASIEGQIVALGTNQPVARAQVVLARVGGSQADYRTGTSDQNGRFLFADVAPGAYRVYTEHQGYLRGEYGRRTASAPGVPISIVAGQASAPLRITMIPTGVISGRVLDSGLPARRVLVRAMKPGFRDGERSMTMSGYAETNDLGEYRIFGLAPGQYIVSALPPNGPRIDGDSYVVPLVPSNANGNRSESRTPLRDALAAGDVDAGAFARGMFVAAFYPGTTDEDAALAVDLAPGSTLTGIDLAVARTSSVRVRGRVIDGVTGQPAEGVNVTVVNRSPSVSITGARVSMGTFELPAVPPGRYDLLARTTSAGARLYGTASVQVGSTDVDNVEILLRPGTTLTGHVTVEDPPEPGRDRPLLVQLVPAFAGAVPVKADGTFTIENLEAGEYRLRIISGGIIPPASARFGGDDVTNAPIRIDGGTQGRTLEIVVSLRKGALDATVLDRNRRPIAGTTVALVPDPPRRNHSELYRTATTDAAGTIHLADVIPGDYTLIAADIEAADWQNPDVLRAQEGRGQRVRIDADSRRTVTLRTAQ